MSTMKGILILVAVILSVCLGMSALGGGYQYVKQNDPIEQQVKIEALNQQKWLNQNTQKVTAEHDARWKPVADQFAQTMFYVAWGLPLVLYVLMFGGAVGGVAWGASRVYVGFVNDMQFLPYDKHGRVRVSRLMALTEPHKFFELLRIQFTMSGTAEVERARNLAAQLHRGVLPNDLRSLTLKAGNTPALRNGIERQLTYNPETASAVLDATPVVFKVTDLKRGNKFELPFGVTLLEGEEIYQPLFGVTNFLIGGSTRSGKTTFLQAMLDFLGLKHTPNEIQFVLIDPKNRGFAPYANDPHTLDFAHTPDGWRRVLKTLESERDRRQQLLSQAWNPNEGARLGLPLLCLFIDELRTVMDDTEVSGLLDNMVAKCLESGITVIGATQLPNAWVIPQSLKTNMRVRACGSMPDFYASRTVLDFAGAERIPMQSYQFLTNIEGRSGPLVRAPMSTQCIPIEGRVVPTMGVANLPQLARPESVVLTLEDKLVQFLQQNGDTSRRGIYGAFSDVTQEELDKAIDNLKTRGTINTWIGKSTGKGGRPPMMTGLRGANDSASWESAKDD